MIVRLKSVHRQEAVGLRQALERAHGENLILRREPTCRGWSRLGRSF
ncbi:hypothetical protein [Streptosporangium amethystogenes]|nr:hypothetical protein [Streptosporangium amethystogenes]